MTSHPLFWFLILVGAIAGMVLHVCLDAARPRRVDPGLEARKAELDALIDETLRGAR